MVICSKQTERVLCGSVVRVDVGAGYGSLFVAGCQVVVDTGIVQLAVDGAQSARLLSLSRTGRGFDVKLRRVVLRVVVVVEVEPVRHVVVEQRLRRRTQSPYSSDSNSVICAWRTPHDVTYCPQLPTDQAGGWAAAIAITSVTVPTQRVPLAL